MPFGFGFRCVPTPPAPTEEVYKRLGVEELQCTISVVAYNSGDIDSAVFSLTYLNEEQLLNAYGFMFVYEDEEVSVVAPATLFYDLHECKVSISGYKLKDILSLKDMKNAHIMFFKKGILK